MSNILTKEQFSAYRKSFKETARNKSLTSADMLVYAYLTGKPINKVFTPISSKVKLANGSRKWPGLIQATQQLKVWDVNSLSHDTFGPFPFNIPFHKENEVARNKAVELIWAVKDAAMSQATVFLAHN